MASSSPTFTLHLGFIETLDISLADLAGAITLVVRRILMAVF